VDHGECIPAAARDGTPARLRTNLWLTTQYTAFAATAFLAGLFIGSYHLSTEDEAQAASTQSVIDGAREKAASQPQGVGRSGNVDAREARKRVVTT
jgi:hypothetical protein